MMNGRDIVDFLAERSSVSFDRGWMLGRLAYGSYICPERRVVYLETPKVACSTMKWVLADLMGRPFQTRPTARQTSLPMSIHERSQHPMASLATVPFAVAQEALTSADWTRFCVVRNPYARIHSAWAEKIREMSPEFRPLVRQILAWDPNSAEKGSVGFPSFLRYLLTAAPKQVRDNPHWSSMSQLVRPDVFNYTDMLRLEQFPDAFESVVARIAPESNARTLLASRRANTSLPSDWRAAYDEECAAAARELAGDDFSLFGYDPDGWRQETRAPLDHASFEAAALSILQDRNELIDALWSRVAALEDGLRASRRWPASAKPASNIPEWVASATVDNARGPAMAGDPWKIGGVVVLTDDAPADLQLAILLANGETVPATWGLASQIMGKRFAGRGNSRRARWNGAGAGPLPVALVLVGAGNFNQTVIAIDATYGRGRTRSGIKRAKGASAVSA
jgi:Sulfotransferase family